MQRQELIMTFRCGIRILLMALAAVSVPACNRAKRAEPQALEAGVPIYPGARDMSSGFTKHLLPQDRDKLVRAAVYETDDPTSKVIDFYKEKLKGKTQLLETKTHGLPSAAIRAEVDGQYKLLLITANEDSGKTEIVIGNIRNAPEKK